MDLAREALILLGDQKHHSMPEFAWTADLNGDATGCAGCLGLSPSEEMEAVEVVVCVQLVRSMSWS